MVRAYSGTAAPPEFGGDWSSPRMRVATSKHMLVHRCLFVSLPQPVYLGLTLTELPRELLLDGDAKGILAHHKLAAESRLGRLGTTVDFCLLLCFSRSG